MSYFTDTLKRWLTAIAADKDRWTLLRIIEPVFDRNSSTTLNTLGLVISSGGATTAKSGAADCYYIANGVICKITAATTMPALTGLNITATKFNVICFFGDSAGVVTAAMGTEGAAVGNVVFPSFPKNKALLGFLLITYASTFTGGTTPLDTATTVYVSSAITSFDPACLTG